MPSKNFVLKTVENIAKEALKAHIIDVKITWVSNYKKFKSHTCNWTPTSSRANYIGKFIT